MKTVLDKATRQELVGRINRLHENSAAQWGKMNVHQMLRHVTMWDEWAAGKHHYPRVFIGYIFGRMALKKVLKDDAPLTRNSPTLPEFRISETTGEIAAEKAKWIALIESYDHFSNPNFVHAFFGKMTEEQIGIMAYKHADHHLRQFGC